MAISKKSWLGLAREATPGTAAAAPLFFVPTTSTMKGMKKREELSDERGTRDAVYGIVDTTRSGTTELSGAWYNDTAPWFLYAAMGAVAATTPDAANAPTAKKHAFSLADIPPTLTLFKSVDAATYKGAYAAVEKWSLKVTAEGKIIESEVSLQHLYPVKHTGAAFTPTFTNGPAFAGYAPKIKLNNVQTNDISELNIEFEQALTLFHPINGSPDFAAIYFGERKLSIDFTARFDDDTLYNRFLNRTDDSLDFTVQGPLIGGTVNQEFNITIPTISYDSMEHDTGKDNVLIKCKATALATPGPLFSAYVINTVPSYTA